MLHADGIQILEVGACESLVFSVQHTALMIVLLVDGVAPPPMLRFQCKSHVKDVGIVGADNLVEIMAGGGQVGQSGLVEECNMG